MNSLAARLAGSAIDFEHLTSWRDRYGKRRWFFRPFRPKRLSRKWPLPGMPGSAAFNAEYNRLHAMLLDGSLGKTETVFFKGTIGWCIEQWRASDEYKAMQDNTKRGNIRYLDNIKRRMGGALLKHLTPQLVIKFRNEIKATSSADAHVLALGKLWGWVLENLTDDVALQGGNPCHGLKKRHDKSKRKSHEPWPREVLEAGLKIAPEEIQVAIEVLLGTGQRVDDATKLKKEHIVDGMVSVPAEPTEFQQKKTGERIFIVPTERLARVLATRPHQNSDYVLNSSRGRKWANGDSLSEMITRWVVAEPGKFTTHGLRANAGIELALSGCSIEELKAVLGHRTAQIALEYLKKMNKLHLVMSATQKRNEWERRRVAEAKAKAKTPNAKAPQNGTSCQRSEQKRA